jgi:hypothetical protein
MLPQPAVEVDDDASPADVFRSGAWSPPAKARVDMIPGHVARFLEAPTPGRREELRYVARRARRAVASPSLWRRCVDCRADSTCLWCCLAVLVVAVAPRTVVSSLLVCLLLQKPHVAAAVQRRRVHPPWREVIASVTVEAEQSRTAASHPVARARRHRGLIHSGDDGDGHSLRRRDSCGRSSSLAVAPVHHFMCCRCCHPLYCRRAATCSASGRRRHQATAPARRRRFTGSRCAPPLSSPCVAVCCAQRLVCTCAPACNSCTLFVLWRLPSSPLSSYPPLSPP